MNEQSTIVRTFSRPNYFALPPLYALVIGINEYASDKYKNLQSAVKDADDFNTYLTSRLHVPSRNIINLRDSNATRANILNAFTELKNITSTDAISRRDIGIIIFFAGHGARCEKPEDWEDWVTVGDFYEALCPADIGTPEVRYDVEDEEVPPIPDRTIAALVNRLSETRGNNITLVFDCCHSAGATRGSKDTIEAENEGYIPRHISNPPSISPNYDHPITANLTRGMGIAKGFLGKNLSSHVLLAACGREQFAYEHPKQPNGVFTYALLKVLNEINVEDLTYTSLMHRLNMPKWQNAHCDGTEVNRRLFNHLIEGGDPRFILGIKRGEKLTMDAGIMQGVTVGSTVSVHTSNLLPISQQPNSPLGTLVVTGVDNTWSTLEQPPSSSAPPIPRMFYCRIVERPSESLAISSPNINWLESIYTKDFLAAHSISIVSDTKAADLVLTPEDGAVYVDHHFPAAAKYIGVRSPFTIPFSNTWMLREVIRCAINFRFHLLRTNPEVSLDSQPLSRMNVRMEMKELEMGYNADYDFVAKPAGIDIFGRDPAIVVVEREKRYGMTVDNLTDLPLYPHLFYFDPSELSITPWYLPPTGAGTSISTHKVDVILPPKSEFPIGYGEGGVDPWEFMLREGEKKDFGFFKLFVTTAPVNLGSMAQECPYHASTSRAGQVSALPAKELGMEVWETVVKGILQVEVGSS